MAANKPKHPGGRPTRYRAEYAEQARKLCLLGYTDVELADFFSVAVSTVYKWKIDHSEFSEATKDGKDIADANVVRSLYERAMGYSHPEDKIFNDNGEPLVVPTTKHYPPDSTAMIFWLKNRQPGRFRDKQEIDLNGDINITIDGDDEKL